MLINKNVGIITENQLTNGNFTQYSYKMDIGASASEVTMSISFPFDVNLIRAKYLDVTSMAGDKLLVEVNPKMTVGVIVASATSSLLQVSPTVSDNIDVGHKVYITDGTNYESLGRCLINESGTITTEIAPTNVYAPMSYIQWTVPMIENLYFLGANVERVIEGTLKANHLPANVPISITYYNCTETEKSFIFDFEVLY